MDHDSSLPEPAVESETEKQTDQYCPVCGTALIQGKVQGGLPRPSLRLSHHLQLLGILGPQRKLFIIRRRFGRGRKFTCIHAFVSQLAGQRQGFKPGLDGSFQLGHAHRLKNFSDLFPPAAAPWSADRVRR